MGLCNPTFDFTVSIYASIIPMEPHIRIINLQTTPVIGTPNHDLLIFIRPTSNESDTDEDANRASTAQELRSYGQNQ